MNNFAEWLQQIRADIFEAKQDALTEEQERLKREQAEREALEDELLGLAQSIIKYLKLHSATVVEVNGDRSKPVHPITLDVGGGIKISVLPHQLPARGIAPFSQMITLEVMATMGKVAVHFKLRPQIAFKQSADYATYLNAMTRFLSL